MKVVLVGSVVFSARMLEVLLSKRSELLEVACVLGVGPRSASRISDYEDLAPIAAAAGVPYMPIKGINSPKVLEKFQKIRPDATFVLGLSQLLSAELLEATGLTIGTHPTLLPDGRGRAAVPWSILLGWKRSGISFFGITEGVDEGLIYEQEAWDITGTDDAESIYVKMCRAGATAFERLLDKLASGTLTGTPQGEPQIGPLPRRGPEDGRIRWSMTAVDIDRLVRATTHPYPGAFVETGGEKIIFWKSGGLAEAGGTEPATILDASVDGVVISAVDQAVRITWAEFPQTGETLMAGRDDFSVRFTRGTRLE